MKEEAFLRRRFSLCPPASTPQKTDPRKLPRNLLLGCENELGSITPGRDMESDGPSPSRDEEPLTPGSVTKVPPAEYRLCNGSDKECTSPTTRVSKKDTLKAQKESYRQEKKRATKQLFSALTDPSVVIMADSLKIRGTLKSWTKLWCVLKPGVLLIYKTPKVGQWVGTVLLHCCELIERPSKKDGFCFKLFHPLDQSVWAVKGPKGESVGSITQPLPSSYLIFRAASESDDGEAKSPSEPDGSPADSVEAARNASSTEKLTDQVMQNPQVLAALQERLDNVSHTPSSYIETLPKAVKRRINALKQLQVRCAHIEAKFYEEVHDLERKYAALYQPLFDKRREFITGDVEPTDAESAWHSENEEEEKLAGDMKNKVVIAEKEAAAAEELNPKGIPEFWFTIFRNVDMLSELVQEYDEPILKHLQDIKVKFSDPGQPMSFVLEFHFEPNDYFTNPVLTKTYKMKSEPDKADPFSFEGPEIVDCDGCTIDWKKGKNVTVKTIKKKQKHKGRGTVRTITKQVPNESFFNFFSPLKASGDGESLDEDSEFTLASDFEIGHFFRERIVPRAVLYFTGEAIEDDDNFEEGEEGEEEELEGDEEGEDEDDTDVNPKKEPSQPAECKQQ
ncbi:nucleosome assembly protein 1-like 4 isoform X1 [Sigmodon hispidus]